MPAYLIVETDIHDPELYERYRAASPAAVAGRGGRLVVRGGELAVQEVMKLRKGAATLRMVTVEGV